MVHLDYRDARPIYTQITDGICSQIAAGILRPGDRLPSVRELAAQLAINPNTIQRAYRQLEADGWVSAVAGKGCFVCAVPGAADRDQLLKTFDQTVSALLAAGVSPQALTARIPKGGQDHD